LAPSHFWLMTRFLSLQLDHFGHSSCEISSLMREWVCFLCIGFAFFKRIYSTCDHLCGLAVRFLGYRSGGPGSIPGTTRKKIVGLERGLRSLVSTTEVLFDRKVAPPV
jgi:hypothetical protein